MQRSGVGGKETRNEMAKTLQRSKTQLRLEIKLIIEIKTRTLNCIQKVFLLLNHVGSIFFCSLVVTVLFCNCYASKVYKITVVPQKLCFVMSELFDKIYLYPVTQAKLFS